MCNVYNMSHWCNMSLFLHIAVACCLPWMLCESRRLRAIVEPWSCLSLPHFGSQKLPKSPQWPSGSSVQFKGCPCWLFNTWRENPYALVEHSAPARPQETHVTPRSQPPCKMCCYCASTHPPGLEAGSEGSYGHLAGGSRRQAACVHEQPA